MATDLNSLPNRQMESSGICEMCGHHVGIRQKAHIMAEGKKTQCNVLLLCPTCHIMFDTHVKPKVFTAMIEAGVLGFPESWRKSIYEQAAEASRKALQASAGIEVANVTSHLALPLQPKPRRAGR